VISQLSVDRVMPQIDPLFIGGLDPCNHPAVPDFTTHSLLGSGEWFVPWNARWSVPGKSID